MIDRDDLDQLTRLRLLDNEGRLARWPTKPAHRLLALRFLSDRFAPNLTYSETEVNDILKRAHDFGDWALLRRELVDRGFLHRDDAGHGYRARVVRQVSAGSDDDR